MEHAPAQRVGRVLSVTFGHVPMIVGDMAIVLKMAHANVVPDITENTVKKKLVLNFVVVMDFAMTATAYARKGPTIGLVKTVQCPYQWKSLMLELKYLVFLKMIMKM